MQNGQIWLFWPKFGQKWIFSSKLRKQQIKKSATSRYHVCKRLDKTNNFDFLGPNLPKNGFWGWNFKNLSLDSESAPPIYHVYQFSVKMDNFRFFGLNLGKFPNYVQCFGSNIVEGVAESWVETEMSLVEVDGAEWRLKWVGWRWMELGGAGCTV